MKTIKFIVPMALGAILAMSAMSLHSGSDFPLSTPLAEGIQDVNCDTICCEEPKYCGVTNQQVILGIQNYRDQVWRHTSPYFEWSSTSTDGRPLSTMPIPREVYNSERVKDLLYPVGTSSPEASEHPHGFDTRFTDIEIDELYNYICFLRNCDPANVPTTLRCYYIRYPDMPDSIFPTSIRKQGKHAIAIVPTIKQYDLNGQIDSAIEIDSQLDCFRPWIPDYKGPREGCTLTARQNHNSICPPYADCIDLESTLLNLADRTP